MSYTSVSVPSIVGGPSTAWKKWFCRGVTRCDIVDGKSVPVEGTVGVYYNAKEDLGALWANLHGDKDALSAHLQVVMNETCAAEGGKAAPAKNVAALIYFLEFALQDQPYFFLRKGRKCYGLYRKTRNYYYDPQELGCHRIGFEFVRLITEEERRSVKLGNQPGAVLKGTANIAIEPEPTLEDIMVSLAKVRGTMATLMADLDFTFHRFNKALE